MNPLIVNKMVEVERVSAISPHSEALFEAGKAILKDSVVTGREFCKSMIRTATGAIPVYLGILVFILPEGFALGIGAGLTIAVPAVGFLIATTLFTIGYFPLSYKFSLDIIDEIEEALEKTIAYRQCFIRSGMVVFIVSTLLAILAIIINIGVK